MDCSAFRDGGTAQIPVTGETTSGDLLDAIYFELAPAVRPFTYGSSWLLARDGQFFTEIGTQWAKRNHMVSDERTLSEIGIQPGSALMVLPIPVSS